MRVTMETGPAEVFIAGGPGLGKFYLVETQGLSMKYRRVGDNFVWFIGVQDSGAVNVLWSSPKFQQLYDQQVAISP